MSIRTRVMRSQAGWYIGQEQLDKDLGCWVPYDRLSNYFYSRWEAEVCLNPDTVNIVQAIQEIESELPRSKKNKHILAKKRTQFLNLCLESFKNGIVPIIKWNYSLYATPNNAIIE